jgi:hypothetical protein
MEAPSLANHWRNPVRRTNGMRQEAVPTVSDVTGVSKIDGQWERQHGATDNIQQGSQRGKIMLEKSEKLISIISSESSQTDDQMENKRNISKENGEIIEKYQKYLREVNNLINKEQAIL